jgi:transcription antitermination factor NusG
MATSSVLRPGCMISTDEGFTSPAEYLALRWYAVQTCSRHEKCVAQQLGQRSVEHFLPVYDSVSRWKDRKVRLKLPLFPGYVFVRLAILDRLRVLQIPSVVRLVGFGGIPTALPDKEIEALKNAQACGVRAEPHPFLTAGQRVRIKAGPLSGLVGILLRRKANLRVVLSIDTVQRSVVVDVNRGDLELCRNVARPCALDEKLNYITRCINFVG